MTINVLLKEKKMSKYRLSKDSGVPYSTLNEICNGKVRIEKCSAETVYKIAGALDVSMETLLSPCLEQRCSFELFKSNVCHQLKTLGDIDFMIVVLKNDEIRNYFRKEWYPECFYLLAMIDYLSRINEIPLCTDYDDLRHGKLKEMLYPTSIIVACEVEGNDEMKRLAEKEAIPEFLRFNIVESEVQNVI